MERKYQAFISYRHTDLDARIAQEVQRSLERFHVPWSVRKETGTKSLAPIFRDKEELPVTSELANDIVNALKSSTHLIVICSTHTCESMWVEREIRTFLEYHPHQNVLTVLADGDPYEIIPEILCKRTDTIELADGTKQEIEVAVEPLSCDFRSPRKSDHRLEVMRLAAAMLGVPFDSLVRRQQRYRRRIATAAAAIVLAIIAYGAWSLFTIQQNYNSTLRGQSTILARNAMEQYESGSYYEALELSLASLPGKNGSRPAVADAEHALQAISRAYIPIEAGTPYPECETTDFGAIHSLRAPDTITEIATDTDGTHVAALLYRGGFACWDVDSEKTTIERASSPRAQAMTFLRDGHLLLLNRDGSLSCIDATDGTPAWNTDLSEAFANSSSFVTMVADEDAGKAVCVGDGGICTADLKDGSITASSAVFDQLGLASITPGSLAAGDGAFAFWTKLIDEDGKNAIVMGKSQDAGFVVSEERFGQIEAIEMLDADHAVISFSEEGRELAGDAFLLRNGSRYAGLSSYRQWVACLDVNTGETLWKTPVELWQPRHGSTLLAVDLEPDDGEGNASVVWCGANTCAWLDAQTGEIEGSIETVSPIITAWPKVVDASTLTESGLEESYPSEWKGLSSLSGKQAVIEACLETGEFASFIPSLGNSIAISAFPADAADAASSERGQFIATDDNVVLFSRGQGDASWRQLSKNAVAPTNVEMIGGRAVVFDLYGLNREDATVTCYDLASCDELFTTSLGNVVANRTISYLGPSADNSQLVFFSTNTMQLLIVDSKDGTLRKEDTVQDPDKQEGLSGVCNFGAKTAGDHIVSGVSVIGSADWRSASRVAVTDLHTMESKVYDVGGHVSVLGPANSSGHTVLAVESSDASEHRCDYVAFDASTGAAIDLGVEAQSTFKEPLAVWGEENSLYLAANGSVFGFAPDGSRRFEMDLEDRVVGGMRLCNGELEMCIIDEGHASMLRLDPHNGKVVGETVLDFEPSSSLGDSHYAVWHSLDSSSASDGGLYVLQDYLKAYVFDEQGKVHQDIMSCIGYDAQTDLFVVTRSGDTAMGTFERYSLEELVARGEDLLGDVRMGTERRQEFGLD